MKTMNKGLHKLFVEELQKLYTAEQAIVEALPKMSDSTMDDDLKDAFMDHLNQTKMHVSRLEDVFESLGESVGNAQNKVIEALLSEGEKIMDVKEGEIEDAALIAAAQKVEHYEIASYGSVIAWAKVMEHKDEADILSETLDEEKETDKLLSKIAEGGMFNKGLNKEADEAEEIEQ